ncbi:MAG TPA: hypothetical protein VIN65_08650 [Candidatus Dormibacteraeota bacterium]
MPTTAEKTTRGVSPILLVLAALCFLLPFVGVSCNTAAGGAALGSALSQAGGSGNSGNSAALTSCLQALNGRDLVTYSGVDLLTGGTPSTATSIPGCDTGSASASSSASSTVSKDAGIGVQPLMVVALVLILLGVVATALRRPLRAWIAGGAALVAAGLIVINNASVHTPILNKLTSSGGGSSLSGLGIAGGLDSFFSIHAAIGFILVLVALVLALAANVVDLAQGSRLRLTTAGPDWRAPPPGGPVSTHPPPGDAPRPPADAPPPEAPSG